MCNSLPLQGPEANLRRDKPRHEPLRGWKHGRTAAPDSSHPAPTPRTSRKEALLLSHTVSDPHHHHSGLNKPSLLKGERTAPLCVRAGREACSHAAPCCSGPESTTRLSSIQDACTRGGGGKSIAAVIRCQHTLSTSALEMVSPKPSLAPLGSATTAARAPCSLPTITDGLPSTPPGDAFPPHPSVSSTL